MTVLKRGRAGRPETPVHKLKEAYELVIIEQYTKKSVCEHLGVTYVTLMKWIKKYQELLDAGDMNDK